MTETAAIRRNVTHVRMLSASGGARADKPDTLATEEPLEVRVAGPGQDLIQVVVTMRTPGNDFELAVGFLFSEGLIALDEVKRVAYCDDLPGEDQRYNVVSVTLNRPFDAAAVKRNFYASSSCGVCGKAALDDIEVRCEPVQGGPSIPLSTLCGLPGGLRSSQKVFDSTGGIHATGLFTPSGDLLVAREDVGRHNAVDKVLGERYLAAALPASDLIMQVSGRASFEIVQKAAVAGIPVVCSVGAPSSLAVETAARFGLTLAGFVREDRCNLYTHPERVV